MHGGLVGTHAHGRHFGIRQFGIGYVMELVSRQRYVFRVTAVGTVAVVIGREIDVSAVIGVDVEIQKAPFSNAGLIHTVTNSHNAPGDVCPLDPRKNQRGLAAHLEGCHFAFFGGIQPFPCLAVGVVLRRCRNLNKHLTGSGRRNRHVLVLQFIDITVTGKNHGFHGVRDHGLTILPVC